MTWRVPASNGGAAITSYRIVVKKGTRTLVARTVSASSRSVILKRAKLANGRNRVYITARNKVGSSPAVSVRFTVRK